MIEMGEDGDAEATRFWRKVGRRSRHECWDWLAARTSVGYGSLRIRGVTRLAHRIAWARTFGPIPAGNELRHTCHYRRCVNPWQLVPGTRRENIQDRARAWRGARSSPVARSCRSRRGWPPASARPLSPASTACTRRTSTTSSMADRGCTPTKMAGRLPAPRRAIPLARHMTLAGVFSR